MTQAICDSPAALMRAWLKKMRPKWSRIREHLGLEREIRSGRLSGPDRRTPAGSGARDLLSSQMLLHRERKIGAAFDRSVIGDDQHFAARDTSYAGDEPGAWGLAIVEVPGGELALAPQKRRANVEKSLHALPWQELAPRGVPLTRARRSTERRLGHTLTQLLNQALVEGLETLERFAAWIDGGRELRHGLCHTPADEAEGRIATVYRWR